LHNKGQHIVNYLLILVCDQGFY